MKRPKEDTKSAARRLGRKRGPTPKLDNRDDAADLLEELRDPAANRAAIARRLGVSVDTLARFEKRHLPKSVREADARLSRLPRPDLQVSQLERLDALATKLDLMAEAIDRALRDPDDPTRYNLDPRAREVTVVFEETVGERRVQKVRKLDDLLERVEQGLGVSVVRWEIKSADLRVLLKDLAVAVKPISELLGKTRGEIRPDPGATINLLVTSPDWLAMRERIGRALEPYPEQRAAVLAALAGGE